MRRSRRNRWPRSSTGASPFCTCRRTGNKPQGEGVRVALLDTGIDESHPDLEDAIDDARDFTRSRGGPADRNGHGTHVAGIVAARQNNRGVVGVAPQSRLLMAKVLGDDGGGSSAAVAAGVDWACDQNADIISMSLGSPEPDPRLLAVIRRATAKGVFVITAAGNSGRANSASNYPARWRETVAVAAVDRNGRLSRFSSRGPQVDIAAPGKTCSRPIATAATQGSPARRWPRRSSRAWWRCSYRLHRDKRDAHTPLRNVNELLEHLRRTALDAGPIGHDPGYGWGLINPDRLLRAHSLAERASAPVNVAGTLRVPNPAHRAVHTRRALQAPPLR